MTASWSTEDSAFVIYEISPMKIFDPRFHNIAIPMPARNTKGIIHESRKTIITKVARSTASPTYIGSSFSHKSLRSVTSADIPVKKQSFVVIFRISFIAVMVSEADVELSKKITIKVALPLLNAS